MAENFGIIQIARYLQQMGLKVSHMDYPRNTIELAFRDEQGQWKMIVGIHQSGETSKLMLIVPHFGNLGETKRLECLEALMAVNYRIAIGKFGVDLTDGEVRLEESIPLAKGDLTIEQFRLAFSAITQTVSIYHNLLSHIISGNTSVQDALQACEQQFFQSSCNEQETTCTDQQTTHDNELMTSQAEESQQAITELDVSEILAEAAWLLGIHQD